MENPLIGAIRQPVILQARYLQTCFPVIEALSTLGIAEGDVYLEPLDIWWPVIIDRLVWQVAAQGGNLRMGIYREGPTIDLPDGGELVVESASVACPAANTIHLLPIADTLLVAGRYWVGLQADATFGQLRRALVSNAGLQPVRYTRAGGYGAFTDPCPVTNAHLYPVFYWVRVAQNLPA